MPEVFAFTGIPGTGIQQALHRFVTYLQEQDISAKYICLDKLLWDEFVNDVESNPLLLDITQFTQKEVSVGNPPDWWKLLILPANKIREYWERSAQTALRLIKASQEKFIFISFHSNYYSDDYRWRFCAVNFNLLTQFNFRAFIVLIDDIYNILERRTPDINLIGGETGTATEPKLKVENLILKTIDYLKQYITWRQEEIFQTDLFAHTCGGHNESTMECIPIPSHVFSVKHPMKTLQKLIENPHFSVYFSHPITDIRADINFPKTEEFSNIYDISKEVRNELTLIEPTTIDEMRIRRIKNEDQDILLPELTKRWQLLDEDKNLLLPPIKGSPFGDIIHKYNLTDYLNKLLQQPIPEESEIKISRDKISDALKTLSEHISDDITWRDYHLVEQTRKLVVYRPCFNGRPSSGVRSELEYYERICDVYASTADIEVVIIHPSKDNELTINKIAENVIKVLLEPNNETVAKSIDNEKIEKHKTTLIEEIAEIMKKEAPIQFITTEVVEKIDEIVQLQHTTSIKKIPLGKGSRNLQVQQLHKIKQQLFSLIFDVIEKDSYIQQLKNKNRKSILFALENTLQEMFNSISALKNKKGEKKQYE